MENLAYQVGDDDETMDSHRDSHPNHNKKRKHRRKRSKRNSPSKRKSVAEEYPMHIIYSDIATNSLYNEDERKSLKENENELEGNSDDELELLDTNKNDAFQKKYDNFKNILSDFAKKMTKHKKIIYLVIGITLFLLYFIYFAFALTSKYGEPPSFDTSSTAKKPLAQQIFESAPLGLIVMTCIGLSIIIDLLLMERIINTIDWTIFDNVINTLRQHKKYLRFIPFIIGLIGIIICIALILRETYNIVSFFGLIILIMISIIISKFPNKISIKTVFWGFATQFFFGAFVLRTSFGYELFKFFGDKVSVFLNFSGAGAAFAFGEELTSGFIFAFNAMPAVIYFSTIVSVLYYWGIMQYVILRMSRILEVVLGTTAGESIVASANIFIGQTEAPLLVRPFLPLMTRSEIHAIMTCGFATVAGGVLLSFIGFGVPSNHLISASVMSAPAALAFAKIIYPETRKTRTSWKSVKNIPKGEEINVLEAALNGATMGLKLVGNILCNVIAFVAILEFINATVAWFFLRVKIQLNFNELMGYLFAPFALIMGVPPKDCLIVGKLAGIKTFANEFVAYQELGKLITKRKNDDYEGSVIYEDRSVIIATYALCGFANLSSLSIMVGGLAAMAPKRKRALVQLAFRALISGTFACFSTACVAGTFFQAEDNL
ncbi:hypothetical protein SNEBB_002177 [Seison nebaliae]|nr:hypothetical protein SNEBB_002177 [Seison nebaliae]